MKKLFFFILPLLIGCDSQTRQYEDYGLTNVSDLLLTADNHPHGWQRSDCFLCHVPTNLHRVDRIGSPNFNDAEYLVRRHGLASCSGCHGKNGVNK